MEAMPVTGEAQGFSVQIAIYMFAAMAVVAAILILSHILGQRRNARATSEPYESGMLTTGSARMHTLANYFPVAMFFVVFDLEVVFLIAWALVAKQLGWRGYIGMAIFVGLLLLVLMYLVRQGALEWDTRQETRRRKQP